MLFSLFFNIKMKIKRNALKKMYATFLKEISVV